MTTWLHDFSSKSLTAQFHQQAPACCHGWNESEPRWDYCQQSPIHHLPEAPGLCCTSFGTRRRMSGLSVGQEASWRIRTKGTSLRGLSFHYICSFTICHKTLFKATILITGQNCDHERTSDTMKNVGTEEIDLWHKGTYFTFLIEGDRIQLVFITLKLSCRENCS